MKPVFIPPRQRAALHHRVLPLPLLLWAVPFTGGCCQSSASVFFSHTSSLPVLFHYIYNSPLGLLPTSSNLSVPLPDPSLLPLRSSFFIRGSTFWALKTFMRPFECNVLDSRAVCRGITRQHVISFTSFDSGNLLAVLTWNSDPSGSNSWQVNFSYLLRACPYPQLLFHTHLAGMVAQGSAVLAHFIAVHCNIFTKFSHKYLITVLFRISVNYWEWDCRDVCATPACSFHFVSYIWTLVRQCVCLLVRGIYILIILKSSEK